MLEMIRYMNGEVRVIDRERMIASVFLSSDDQSAQLADYDLSEDIEDCDLAETFIVLRVA